MGPGVYPKNPLLSKWVHFEGGRTPVPPPRDWLRTRLIRLNRTSSPVKLGRYLRAFRDSSPAAHLHQMKRPAFAGLFIWCRRPDSNRH